MPRPTRRSDSPPPPWRRWALGLTISCGIAGAVAWYGTRDWDAYVQAENRAAFEALYAKTLAERPTEPALPELPDTPPALATLGRRFVATVNARGMNAFPLFKVDAFGNLYLMMGDWWFDLSTRDQVEAATELDAAWKQYVADAVPATALRDSTAPLQRPYLPGIILLTERGVVARALNDTLQILDP